MSCPTDSSVVISRRYSKGRSYFVKNALEEKFRSIFAELARISAKQSWPVWKHYFRILSVELNKLEKVCHYRQHSVHITRVLATHQHGCVLPENHRSSHDMTTTVRNTPHLFYPAENGDRRPAVLHTAVLWSHKRCGFSTCKVTIGYSPTRL
jgi:hypothetical protein